MALRRGARRLGLLLGALILLGLALVCGWIWAISWRPPPETYRFQGVDVSEADGPIDWFAVQGGQVDFAYVRATIGADRRDTRFADNWSLLYQADIRRGAIHVFSLCRLARDQAANFVTTVPRTADALPVAVDLDFDSDCPARPDRAVLLGELRTFISAVETHTGVPVLLRISRAFERQYEVSAAIPRGLWCAQSFFKPAYTVRPWRMWQASRIRRIPGVDRPIHWDVVAP